MFEADYLRSTNHHLYRGIEEHKKSLIGKQMKDVHKRGVDDIETDYFWSFGYKCWTSQASSKQIGLNKNNILIRIALRTCDDLKIIYK